jgi:hypothetical protein
MSAHHTSVGHGSVALGGSAPDCRSRQCRVSAGQHLAAVGGVDLEVRLEITAVAKDGFDGDKARTIRENAHKLKFEQSGFEAD